MAQTIDLKNFDAVLFDLDGVLTTTRTVHAAAWKRMFDEFLEEWDANHGTTNLPFDDRADYSAVVAKEIYNRPSSSFTPGKCLVRVVSTGAGISRSDAVIVADEGDFLFHRCMVEEILQGLGPINDDRSLSESVFNDTSRHSTFTDFDRRILTMLYHPLVEPGMTKLEVARILPRRRRNGIARQYRADVPICARSPRGAGHRARRKIACTDAVRAG